MSLVDKQHFHAMRLARLFFYADSLGYQIAGGAWGMLENETTGERHDLHTVRLLTNVNVSRHGTLLFDVDSVKPLGDYWETLGGTWGGNFDTPKVNHFSTPYQGHI